MPFRIEVQSLIPTQKFERLCRYLREAMKINLQDVAQVSFYKIDTNESLPQKILDEVFSDPIMLKVHTSAPPYHFKTGSYSTVIEVTFRPGVTDNPGHTAGEALALLGHPAQVYSGEMYFLIGEINETQAHEIAKEYFGNDLIQKIEVFNAADFAQRPRFSDIAIPQVHLEGKGQVEKVDLHVSDQELLSMNERQCLALTLEELHFIRQHFDQKENREKRQKMGLPLELTDVELEIIAQTWSEHCKHKIFAAEIDYTGPDGQNETINGLFKTFIRGATEKVKSDRQLDWLISVFSDNAGIVRFDKNIDLCIKVETHNSPSALDPYGGALTGILGVNRDILGCGLGARPIANTDVFCFAPPELSESAKEILPATVKSPRRIMEGVHKGIEDGGNKSGIPTVNGAFYFHEDYAGKPLVFCGTVGALPPAVGHRPSAEKKINPKDRIVM
ncbi:MAG: AIR synthase related protein, partial [Pseudomonadota bacterium]